MTGSDNRRQLVERHGMDAMEREEQAVYELVELLLPQFVGRSNVAIGSALLLIMSALAMSDGVGLDGVIDALRRAWVSDDARSLADTLRDAMRDVVPGAPS
jgi:hypothetical protein